MSKINNNAEYRKYMINNASTQMKDNLIEYRKMCCVPDNFSNTQTKNEPYLFKECESDFPYIESDLKREYMEKLQHKCSSFSTVFK